MLYFYYFLYIFLGLKCHSYIFKNSSNGPTLSWVEIGISDLANVEIKKGLTNGDQVFVLPSKGLVDYQNRFKERVKNSFG